MGRFGSSSRLVPGDLGLSPHDSAIANVIAEEAESERLRRRGPEPKLKAPKATGFLLGGEWDYFDSLPWYDLIQSIDVLVICASRTALSIEDVLSFAQKHCNPAEPWGLFWMEAYLRLLHENTDNLIGASRAIGAVAAAERKSLAMKGATARAGKYKGAEDATCALWLEQQAEWLGGKKEFAEFQQKQLAKEGVKVSVTTITDKWLAPSRLAGK